MYCGYSQGWAIYCGTLHVEGGGGGGYLLQKSTCSSSSSSSSADDASSSWGKVMRRKLRENVIR